MPDTQERDNTTFTACQFLHRSPRSIAAAVFFVTVLGVLRLFLRIAIRLNAVTFCNYDFHFRAMELLHQTRVLLSMRDIR